MPAVRVRLLGRFELRADGAEVALESARAESLLAYLLLHRGEPQPRERLAALLWPESTQAQARTNLRHVLHTVRGRLPDPAAVLDVTTKALCWRGEVWLDVAEFERLLDAGHPEEAVEIHAGELLDGCDDEWLRPERDRLRARLGEALAVVVERAEGRGDLAAALAHAERLRGADPLREATYRLLMRLHDARGERARALAVYHECASTLERELGVAPSAATRAADEALVGGGRAAAAGRAAGHAALVGRVPERAALAAAWRAAERAEPRFVLVGGEPGVGKSRLVEELRAWCARRGAAVADARCYAAEGPLAYGPVVAWLRGSALAARVARLDAARRADLARLLPELGDTRPEPLPAAELRLRLLDAVAAAVLAPGPPVLLTVDDLQHTDRETCAALHYLLRADTPRLLVVATARTGEIDALHPARELLAGLHALDRCTEIELGALGPAETAQLAHGLAGAPLSEAQAHRLHEETEGNALFVVEALRAGWSPGAPASARVQAVIGARLAQLTDPARELVAVAATIGRAFRVDVLAAAMEAAATGEDELVTALDELWQRRIVREQGPDTYDFAHDRIREVAAAAVGPVRRRLLHARIAAALERSPGADPAAVAGHYEAAGRAADAVRWYRVAAEAAQLLHADRRAVELLDRALVQLETLPAGPGRDAEELAVRTAILAPLALVDGYASPATSVHQERARELSGGAESPPLLRSLALTALSGSDFAAATRAGHLLRAAGERDGDDVGLVEAGYVLGVAAFWQADFAGARDHFTAAVARYRPEHSRVHLIRYAQDPKVTCLGRLANTLWFLGRADEAFAAREGALAWARELGHPLSTGVGLLFAALLDLDAGDDEALRARVAAMAEVRAEQPPFRLSRAALTALVAGGGPDEVDAAAAAVPGGIAAPGQTAVLARVRLAAAVRTGDAALARAASRALLDLGGPACVWAPEAHRVLGVPSSTTLRSPEGPGDQHHGVLGGTLPGNGAGPPGPPR
ncbi:MAG: AAA family ATPase [Pseudonocardia sp.]